MALPYSLPLVLVHLPYYLTFLYSLSLPSVFFPFSLFFSAFPTSYLSLVFLFSVYFFHFLLFCFASSSVSSYLPNSYFSLTLLFLLLFSSLPLLFLRYQLCPLSHLSLIELTFSFFLVSYLYSLILLSSTCLNYLPLSSSPPFSLPFILSHSSLFSSLLPSLHSISHFSLFSLLPSLHSLSLFSLFPS